METARLFIAFSLPDEVQQHLALIQKKLATMAPSDAFRWIHPGNTHITLHFLGDTPRDRIPSVIDALRAAAIAIANQHAVTGAAGPKPTAVSDRRGIRCKLGGVGYFPHIDNPRVLWLGLNEVTTRHSADLTAQGRAYFQSLEQELTARGLESSSPRYAPHITLGYRRRKANRSETAAVTAAWQQYSSQGLIFSLQQIVLYESVVAQRGREHRRLHTQPLG
ncbi:2'-5' RNA ligase family protein [Spirochaeta africana]|uniref:RNA 2',3'-cyclic phosphodiesterase n=1 Tax=Spirochaeta africana (strain ATCC 700263 / DSM 8902 / Z-7692) TaxID=889378 RepID=H9UFS8_SPIAZ|nr:2'-5' RNA ligase family protein [Spirochaeta africana]AFG36371.1 2'-5' RNA ligase [Spirochaeta africana DSM 8902]